MENGKSETGAKGKEGKDAENDIDALFQLPLGEFTGARNALAARLNKAGRADKAAKVKALAKPSVSAWAANQLYWKHKDPFNNLIAAGRQIRQAQAAQLAGKAVDIHGTQAARREALSTLTRLAAAVLRDAGHNPAPDTMRRIITTLEALSIHSSASDAPTPGRLIEDVSPLGFESVAELIPAGGPAKRPAESAQIIPFRPPPKKSAGKPEERDISGIAAAKAALQAAERALREARIRAEDALAAQMKAAAHVSGAEKKRLEAEERYDKARIAEQEARKRLHNLTAEAERAARALDAAAHAVEKAREDLKGKRP